MSGAGTTAGRLFDGSAEIYDRTRRQLIPCFDAFYGAAVDLVPLPREAPLEVLDLGAGTGVLAAHLAAAFPSARFTLVDAAERMLAVARRRFAAEPAGRFAYVVADFARLALPPARDLVVSALAIHHLDDAGKRALFARAYDALAPGGAFVNAEQVLGPTPDVEDAYQRSWLARARAAGVPEADLEAALERMTADRTAPLEDQLRWLREAGFRDVRCAFQDERFAVYGGVRPARRAVKRAPC